MVANAVLTSTEIANTAEAILRSLSHASYIGSTAFIATAVTYSNGTAVVVRVEQVGNSFYVSDEAGAHLNAIMFGGKHKFSRNAVETAKRFGVSFDDRNLFLNNVTMDQLPAAVSLVANASSIAMERTVYALDRSRITQDKDLFRARLVEAFGDTATFDVNLRGSTKSWEVDAAIVKAGNVVSIFELVTPAPASVAFAHMKVGDITSMSDHPSTTVVLSDYENTDPPLRQILSTSADHVIAANSNVSDYRKSA